VTRGRAFTNTKKPPFHCGERALRLAVTAAALAAPGALPLGPPSAPAVAYFASAGRPADVGTKPPSAPVAPMQAPLSGSSCLSGPAGTSCLSGSAGTQDASSGNWSGYVAQGGPYASVTGTFSVPHTGKYLAGSTLSEWVGIDGWTDDSLLQAGVDEIPQKSGSALVEPWFEVLPSPQRLVPGVMVRPGDLVTVTLAQAGQQWRISLADDSNGEAFNIAVRYEGDLTSAEWIVEANSGPDGSTTPLSPYQPAVLFSGARLAGPQSTLDAVTMNQSGAEVSAPSPITMASFRVTYQANGYQANG